MSDFPQILTLQGNQYTKFLHYVMLWMLQAQAQCTFETTTTFGDIFVYFNETATIATFETRSYQIDVSQGCEISTMSLYDPNGILYSDSSSLSTLITNVNFSGNQMQVTFQNMPNSQMTDKQIFLKGFDSDGTIIVQQEQVLYAQAKGCLTSLQNYSSYSFEYYLNELTTVNMEGNSFNCYTTGIITYSQVILDSPLFFTIYPSEPKIDVYISQDDYDEITTYYFTCYFTQKDPTYSDIYYQQASRILEIYPPKSQFDYSYPCLSDIVFYADTVQEEQAFVFPELPDTGEFPELFVSSYVLSTYPYNSLQGYPNPCSASSCFDFVRFDQATRTMYIDPSKVFNFDGEIIINYQLTYSLNINTDNFCWSNYITITSEDPCYKHYVYFDNSFIFAKASVQTGLDMTPVDLLESVTFTSTRLYCDSVSFEVASCWKYFPEYSDSCSGTYQSFINLGSANQILEMSLAQSDYQEHNGEYTVYVFIFSNGDYFGYIHYELLIYYAQGTDSFVVDEIDPALDYIYMVIDQQESSQLIVSQNFLLRSTTQTVYISSIEFVKQDGSTEMQSYIQSQSIGQDYFEYLIDITSSDFFTDFQSIEFTFILYYGWYIQTFHGLDYQTVTWTLPGEYIWYDCYLSNNVIFDTPQFDFLIPNTINTISYGIEVQDFCYDDISLVQVQFYSDQNKTELLSFNSISPESVLTSSEYKVTFSDDFKYSFDFYASIFVESTQGSITSSDSVVKVSIDCSLAFAMETDLEDQLYVIGEDDLSFELPLPSTELEECNDFTYDIQILKNGKPTSGNSTDFMDYDFNSETFTVDTNSVLNKGVYTVVLSASHSTLDFDLSHSIQVTLVGDCSQLDVQVGNIDSIYYVLGESAIEVQMTPAEASFEGCTLQYFMIDLDREQTKIQHAPYRAIQDINYEQLWFKVFTTDITQKGTQNYQLVAFVTETLVEFQSNSFLINVFYEDPETLTEIENQNLMNNEEDQGEDTAGENDEPVDQNYDRFQEVEIYLEEFDYVGNIRLYYSDSVVVNDKYSYDLPTNQSSNSSRRLQSQQSVYECFTSYIEPGFNQNTSQLGYELQVAAIDSQILEFLIIFENPFVISQGDSPDFMHIEVTCDDLLESEDPSVLISTQGVLLYEIPPQMDQSSFEQVQAQAQAVVSSTSSFMLGAFLIQLVLYKGMEHLWKVFLVMQVLTHLSLINFKYPANVQAFLSFLYELANFDVVPEEVVTYFTEKISSLNPADQMSSKLENSGYGSTSLFANLGSIFIFTILFLLLVLFVVVGSIVIKKKSLKNKIDKLKAKLFYNSMIVSLKNGYLKYLLASFISIQAIVSGITNSFFESYTAFVLIFLLILFPLWSYLHLSRNRANLQSDQFKKKYEQLYKDLAIAKNKDQKTHRGIILYQPVFMIRRVLLAFNVVFLASLQPTFNYFYFSSMQLLVLIYIGYFQPFEFKLKNLVEIINEFLLMITCYFMSLFTDYLTAEFRFTVGQFFIYMVMVQIAFNVMVLVVSLGSSLCKLKRQKDIKKLHDKRKKKLAAQYQKDKEDDERIDREKIEYRMKNRKVWFSGIGLQGLTDTSLKMYFGRKSGKQMKLEYYQNMRRRYIEGKPKRLERSLLFVHKYEPLDRRYTYPLKSILKTKVDLSQTRGQSNQDLSKLSFTSTDGFLIQTSNSIDEPTFKDLKLEIIQEPSLQVPEEICYFYQNLIKKQIIEQFTYMNEMEYERQCCQFAWTKDFILQAQYILSKNY